MEAEIKTKRRIEEEAKRLAELLDKQNTFSEPLSEASDQKVNRAIHLTAGVCAAVAIQPLPFADILILTPIQATLAYKIARLRGHQVSREHSALVLKQLPGVIGLGLLAQQTALGLYKLGLPGLGGLMSIPLVYGLTYSIGRVIDYYYVSLGLGESFDANRAKKIFKKGRIEGKSAGKKADMARLGKKASLADEALVLLTIAALRLDELQALSSTQSQMVLEAIKRSTDQLCSSSSVADVADYIQGFGEDQLPGLINNIKGITFEIQWTHAENSDADSVHAHMFHDTNHPASDVVLTDGHTVSQIQLKATDSANYVHQAMINHPDIPVVSTSEVAHRVPGAIDGGISNAELSGHVKNTIDQLHDSASHTLTGSLVAGGLAAGIQAVPILNDYRKKRINKQTAKKLLARRCGLSAAKAAGLVLALHSPLAPVAGAYIAFRIIKRGVQVVADNCGDGPHPRTQA